MIRSASWVGVLSPTATSFVRWLPPSDKTAVWAMAPPAKIAMSVVPPPMSTRQTPSSFSSSERVASELASGCSTMSATLRPVRWAHLTMFWAEETAPVTMRAFASSRTPLMPTGSFTPSWSSTRNSCGSTWMTSRSSGMATAFAWSMTRSTSVCLTSLSLMATTPWEGKALMWPPAMPV